VDMQCGDGKRENIQENNRIRDFERKGIRKLVSNS
jgi:hypothetical protein